MTSQLVSVASTRRVGWGGMNTGHLRISYLIQVLQCTVCNHKFQKYYRFTQLTVVYIHTADNTLLPLLFLRSDIILSGFPIIILCSCQQEGKLSCIRPKAYNPQTRLRYSNFLPICLMIMEALSIHLTWIPA
jgi:hypothetical protein